MEDAVTETQAPATEETNTTEAEPQEAPTAIDMLVNEVSEKLEASKANRDLDYIDDGDDLDPPPAATGTEDTVESLKARLQEEQSLRLRAENRSSARNLREKMKEEFPNANPDTVDKYLRLVASGRKSSDSVRAIFGASNGDFARGEEASDKKWKARFEELQKTAKADAEKDVQQAWGTPASSTPIGGAGKMSYEELRTIANKPGVTPQELAEAEKQYFGG